MLLFALEKLMFYREVITTRVTLKSCSRFLFFHQIQTNLPAMIPSHNISICRHLLHTEHSAI